MRFFFSVAFAVILIVVLLVLCVVGTVIPQDAADAYYLEHYGPSLTAVFHEIGLLNVFHSRLFKLVLVVLGVNLVGCTLKRRSARLRQAGFFLIHLSLILIVIGAAIHAQWGQSGLIRAREGNTYESADAVKLPFGVRLVGFEAQWYPAPDRIFVFDSDGQNVKGLDPTAGASYAYRLGGETYRLKVLRSSDQPDSFAGAGTSPEEQQSPSLFITPHNEKDARLLANDVKQGWWLSADLSLYVDFVTSNEAVDLKATEKELTPGRWLEVEALDGSPIAKLAVDAPGEFTADGRGFRIEALHYYPQFQLEVQTAMSVSDVPSNPAVQVRVTGESLERSLYVFADHPEFHSSSTLPFRVRFVYPRSARAKERVRFVFDESSKRLVAVDILGDKSRLVEAPVGRPMELLSGGRLERVRFSPSVTVSISDGSGSRTERLLLDGSEGSSPDGRVRLLYAQAAATPEEFISTVELIENGQVAKRAEIKVNWPLTHRGYTLYQQSYEMGSPVKSRWVSVLEVSRDPGLVVAYIGFVALMAGVCFVFYVKPFLKGKEAE
jgi:hypothetical protein